MTKSAALPLRFSLLRRQQVSFARRSAVFGGGILLGVFLAALILVFAGLPPASLWDDIIVQRYFSSMGLPQTLTLSAPLMLAGLAATAAMRIRFWNVGIEGQLWLGAIGASAVALNDIGTDSSRLTLMLLASALAGAAWIALPLLVKMRLRVNELVVTLLMSNIAYLLLQHLLFGVWKDPANSFPISPRFDANERLGLLGFGNLHQGIWIALIVAVLMAVLILRSRRGFHVDAISHSESVARALGIPVASTLALMVLLSGALAGLAGGVIVSGVEYRLTQTIGLNMTFSAIVIAYLARFNPLAVILVAIIVAGIYSAGDTLKVFYGLPDAIIILVQGVVLLSVLLAQFAQEYQLVIQRGAR